MTKRKLTNVGTRVLSILCLISTLLYLFAFLVLIINIWGVADAVSNVLITQMNYTPTEAEGQLTMMNFELVISIFFSLYCFRYYKTAPYFSRNENELGKKVLIMGIFQLFFGMVLTGFIALIIGIVKMNRKAVRPIVAVESGIPNHKLELMGEAVERLKKLRKIGAISEEEYYINLNKILEG